MGIDVESTCSRDQDQNHFIDGQEWTDGDTFQDKVCYDCLKPFCDNPNCSLRICSKCGKDYCAKNVFQLSGRYICVLSVGL